MRDIFYDPQHPYTHGLLHATPRLDEAIASFRKALQFRPDLAKVHHNLGVALAERGREIARLRLQAEEAARFAAL